MREKLTFSVFAGFIGLFFLLNISLEPPEVLKAERRRPAAFPELSARTLLSGGFMNKFESFAEDRFPFRDGFRGIRAFTVLDLQRQSDKSGLYRDAAVGLGEFYPVDEESCRQTAGKLKAVAERLKGLSVYFSVIPDKSNYAGQYLPGSDHALVESILDFENYIPLGDVLNAGCYYKTDLHWDQTKIQNAAGRLLSSMGAHAAAKPRGAQLSAGEFYGVYAGRLGLAVEPDALEYYDAPDIEAGYLNDRTLRFEPYPVYEPERIADVDPYDVFLRGPQPLVALTNAAAENDRELYLFRDSFGSSLAPLLAGAYSRVTVIDLRYVQAELLFELVDFKRGSDALFILGAQIFNNPSVLLV